MQIKISKEDEIEPVEFCEIKTGDVLSFVGSDIAYLKVVYDSHEEAKLVNLLTGEVSGCHPNSKCRIRKYSFTLIER